MKEMPPSANDNLESHTLEKYIKDQIVKLQNEVEVCGGNILLELNIYLPNYRVYYEEILTLFRNATNKHLEDFTRLCEEQISRLITAEKSCGFLNLDDCKHTIDVSYSNLSRKINKLSSLIIQEIGKGKDIDPSNVVRLTNYDKS